MAPTGEGKGIENTSLVPAKLIAAFSFRCKAIEPFDRVLKHVFPFWMAPKEQPSIRTTDMVVVKPSGGLAEGPISSP